MSLAEQPSQVVGAGTYTRISSDSNGQRAGVERQRADCDAHCLARGWEVAEVFLRQRRRGVQRETATGLRADVGHGSRPCDRRHRHVAQRPASPLAEGAGGVHRPGGALRRAIGRGHRRRLRPDHARRPAFGSHRWRRGPQGVRGPQPPGATQHPEQGKPAGELGRGVRCDDERELVREAARRVLAGQGLITIVRDWNRRSVPGPTPRPWGHRRCAGRFSPPG